MLTVDEIRKDFPILSRKINGKQYAYLDNTTTTHKPLSVIKTMTDFLKKENSSVNRGVYYLSQKATARCEETREKVQRFINAKREEEVVFTKGTTEAINLVATSFGSTLKKGDEVIITEMEHHANIVPWQQVCLSQGAIFKVIPFSDSGMLDQEAFDRLLSHKTKIVAITHCSNVLGTINSIKKMVEKAHKYGAKVLIDGAQAIQHLPIDVQDLDCDFYCFSGHKLYGPTGIGILYGKYELLSMMPPYQTGGDMIDIVTFEKTTFKETPYKFEAGTSAIVEIIGLGATIDYLENIGYETITLLEVPLLEYAMSELKQIEGISIYGSAAKRAGIISFNIDGVHAHDAGTIFDDEGVALRVGHHCAQPIMTHFGIPATIRASIGFYNTKEEIDKFIIGVKKIKEFFK
ncbi:MAG: cysteine desulfurase [bacterium]|nr:cysteine desulfurase [bacterium]